jgi:hypothetical protein
LTSTHRVARERESRTIRGYFCSELCSTRVKCAFNRTGVEALAWSIIGPAYLDSWVGSRQGRSVRQRAARSLKSDKPKGLLATHDKWGYKYLGQSRLRVEILSCQVRVARKGLCPLRQLHWLKRFFVYLYCRKPVRAHSGYCKDTSTFALICA